MSLMLPSIDFILYDVWVKNNETQATRFYLALMRVYYTIRLIIYL